MWWRTVGVALVLLIAGALGGYAVADRSTEEPAPGDGVAPVPAVSPAVPTPAEFDVLPDPTAEPLQPDLPHHVEELRLTKRGAGVGVSVPDGWQGGQTDSLTWTYVPAINIRNTYMLRVDLKIGQRLAVQIAKDTRLNALRSAEEQGNLQDLEIIAETDDSFEATYIDDGYRRVTMERWVGDDNDTAYADIAVTGRVADTEGLRDLVVRVAESAQQLDPLPPKEKDKAQG